jgi:hypothetical protein
MVEQHYALYVEGEEEPIGTLRDSTIEAVEVVANATGEKYRTEPITFEQAKEIKDSLTRLPPKLEALLNKPII